MLDSIQLRGTQPLYIDKNWNRVDQTNQKQRKKTNCSKGCVSVIFIQATPNGELARQFREVEESYPGAVKFKIVKKSVKSMLQKSNPGRNISCSSADCLVCKIGRGTGGDCRKTNIGYEIMCDEFSESSRNGYVRGLEHVDKYRRQHVDSAMYKHAQTHHRGRKDVEYSIKITGSFQDPLSRQVEEWVRIQRSKADILLY